MQEPDRLLKAGLFVCLLAGVCQIASGDATYNVSLNTAPLVGHPGGPFYVELSLTDGSGVNDANNTATVSNISFGGGNALGSPLGVGGASGSLETGVTIVDSTFVSLFYEQFVPGLQLSFLLNLTTNDDAGGIPDRFVFSLLDSSGVPLPTQSPVGDYFFGVDLHSSGPLLDAYGSDTSRAPTVGDPVSIPAPTITAVSSVPEPSALYILVGLLVLIIAAKHWLID